ncbi:hypothetical protein L7F22_032509 [Adiantum nelumboides]|nr:hypothetical protein [Adiantum nelumboides]
MVDSKEIEELRALVFASIPAVARRTTGSSSLKGKRRYTSLDTEEGEILSDEDAAATVGASTIDSTLMENLVEFFQVPSMSQHEKEHLYDVESYEAQEQGPEIHVDHLCNTSDAFTRQRGTLPVSRESLTSISTEPPSLVAIAPSHNNILNSEEICNLASDRPAVTWTSKGESATQVAVGTDSGAKNELSKVNQRLSRMTNGLRPFRSATGPLPSRIPTAPLPTGGLRKEAEAFLASLNIPAMASSSHLPAFTGDGHNSLVIKFSDDDSDTDEDPDDQVVKDMVSSKKLIGSESQLSSSLAHSRMGLATQTTSGLISEIDRVKKQIAAIERAKGSPPVSKASKTTPVEFSRQLNLKPGVPTSAVSSRMAPVDLESLRQQIAAKESELKRRKQRGSREFLNNGIASASSWLIDTLEVPDARALPTVKSESQVGVAEVCLEDVPVASEVHTNEASDESLLKVKNCATWGPDFEQENSLCDGVLEMATSVDVLPAAAAESVTMNLTAQIIDQNDKPVPSQITNSASKQCDLPSAAATNLDTTGNKANCTPKRKRQESDIRSQSVKRAKKKGPLSIPESSLMLPGFKGGQDCQFEGSLSDGNIAASVNVSGGIQSPQSREPSMLAQGMPMALATTKAQQDKDVRTTSMQKGSDGRVSSVQTCQINDIIADNHKLITETAVLLQNLCSKDLPGNGVVDTTLQVDEIAQNADKLNHLGINTGRSLSPHSSPSRALEEQPENFGVLSMEQSMLQGSLYGARSTCSSLPVWDCSNSHVQLLQGVPDQRLEYMKDSLWKLQEEEDAVDKKLEEAQQNRRRCEVREHFARKQYRDAQEALHVANVQCEMLFQKREMLCASVKAAQLRLYSNRPSWTHHGEGGLISLNVPECSGRDSFSFGTSLWTRKKGNNANAIVNLMSDHDYKGTHSDFVSDLNQDRTLSRGPEDRCLIAEAQQSRANVNGLEEAVVLNSSGSESTKSLLSKHANADKDSGTEHLSPQKITTVFSAEIGRPTGDLHADSVSQRDIGLEIPQKLSEGRPPGTAITVAVNGSSEKDSLGFSSASFATDLWRDGNQTRLLGEKTNTIKEQEVNTRESSFSSRPSDHLSLTKRRVPFDSFNGSSAAAVKVHSSSTNEVYSCAVKSSELSHEPECDKTAGLSQEQLQQGDDTFAVEKIDGSKKGVMNVLSVADTFLNRQDSVSLEAHMSSADSLSKLSLSKHIEKELDEVQESSKGTTSHDGKLMRNFPVLPGSRFGICDNHELPVVDPDKARQGPLGNAETEIDIVPVQNNVFKVLDEAHKLKLSASPISLVISAGLNLLFSHAPDLCSSKVWKQLIGPDKAAETIPSLSVNFESGTLQSMKVVSPRAKGLRRLDPHKILCMFEHRGKCKNDECVWQHKRDYLLFSSETQTNQVVEGFNCPEVTEMTGSADLKCTNHSKYRDGDENNACSARLQTSWRGNAQAIKPPIYSIGSYFTRMQILESVCPGIVLKRQLESGAPFLALHRRAPIELPCLFDSSLKLPTLNDGSIASRQLRVENTLWIQNEGRVFSTLGDAESVLEAALELCHYSTEVQNLELRKSVLYVLSRGLEANPGSVALWVVYLHLFYKWEKGSSKDDLFLSAVQHNEGSYELWMLFINTRWHLKDRLEAYESAIITIGSRVDLQCHPLERKSSLLLDLALRKLNCLCTSGLNQEATNWITQFTLSASENRQGLEMHERSSSLSLVNCLSRPDLCILWICCAYVILRRELPDRVVESLGCKQELFFQNIWSGLVNMSSCTSQAMKLMQIAASQGKGCMKLDVHEPGDKNLQLAKEVFAANFVQCAAVCEGLDCSLILAEKYSKKFSASVELTLLRARHEEHFHGKMASLEIFEEALTCWPLDQTGKMRLWNQYIECAYEAKGPDFVKGLLARCGKEISDSDSFRFVCGNVGTIWKDPEQPICAVRQGSSASLGITDTPLQSTIQLLPLIVKQQQMKGSGSYSQRFSFQDAVFSYMNLAFFETLNKDYKAARIALQNGLNVAVEADSVRHCLNEIAVFIYKGLDSSSVLSPTVHSNKMLGLVDRCIVESQLIGAVYPLSKGFCETIKSRQVSQFVGSLVCPLATDSSFLNSLLESIHGPTLLPNELLAWPDRLDIAEKFLEILPSNVRLAASNCRAVQNKVSEFDSKSGPATLFWCTSLLIDSLCNASPEAPEPRWVEAGGFLKMLEADSLLEDFYWLALLVYPHSSLIWHGLLEISRKTGNFESALKSAKERGVKLELDLIS